MSKIGIWYVDEYFKNDLYDGIYHDEDIVASSVNKHSLADGTTITFIRADSDIRNSNFDIGFVQENIDDNDLHGTVFYGLADNGEVYRIKNYRKYKKIIENLNKE